jgi:hypothetical protein
VWSPIQPPVLAAFAREEPEVIAASVILGVKKVVCDCYKKAYPLFQILHLRNFKHSLFSILYYVDDNTVNAFSMLKQTKSVMEEIVLITLRLDF